jgi:hypothetical protein
VPPVTPSSGPACRRPTPPQATARAQTALAGCLAKYAEALRKISFVRLSSRFSCSSSLIRAASTEVIPGFTPASMSACLTQARSDSVPIPSWVATRFTVP